MSAPTDPEALIRRLRPKVIDDLLAVDDTGTVANYIRQLEAELSALIALTVRADSYLSLLWHRPSASRDGDLALKVERTIGDLRKVASGRVGDFDKCARCGAWRSSHKAGVQDPMTAHDFVDNDAAAALSGGARPPIRKAKR